MLLRAVLRCFYNADFDKIYVKLMDDNLLKSNTEIFLFDQLGRVLVQKPLISNTETLSCANYTKGIYLLYIVSSGAVFDSRKIFIK